MFKPFEIVLDVSNRSMNDMFEVSTNDLNTIRLDIKVKEGLSPFDLTGKIVRLAIQKPDKNAVFQTGGVTNGEDGLCEVILSRQANVVEGRHEAELMIFEGDATVAVTTKFFYNVKKALLNDDAVKSSSDFPAINQAILAGQVLEGIDVEMVADAGAKVQGIQAQVDQLVIEGDSSVEAAQMRVDAEGVAHVTAKARADSDYNKAAKQSDLDKYSNQEDFVKAIKRHTTFKPTFTVSCKNIEKSQFVVLYELLNGKAIEYNTNKSSLDGYTPISQGKIGNIQNEYPEFERRNYDSKTGTHVTTSPPNLYTTEVGATLVFSFFGAGLDFYFFGDNRGGNWRFVVDGDTANPIDISTWRSSGLNTSAQVFRKTVNKQYNVIATFTGADPSNAPVGGTARGWYFGDGDVATKPTFKTFKRISSVLADTMPLYGDSNKEFAISMRKSGTTNPYYYCPLHTAATAIPIEIQFLVNGIPKTFEVGEAVEGVTEFKLIQKIYARNPESPENLAKITTVTTFKNDGSVNIDGRFEALVGLDIDRGYAIMFPIGKPFSDTLLTSIENQYPINRSDGYEQYLNDEKDQTTSFISLSNTFKDIGVACTFENPKQTLRWKKPGKRNPDTIRTYIQHRDTTMAKLYPVLFYNASVPVGEVLRFSGTYFIGNFNGLRDLFIS